MQDLVFRYKLSIAIPASLVSDIPHLREKTMKIGEVGRAAAIFRISEVVIFSDAPNRNQGQEFGLIHTVLSYIETPQYLRKRLFKIRPELRYAGVLPPLRTPHHPLSNQVKDLVDGEYREGVIVTHTKGGTLADVGVERHALIRNKKMPIDTRVTLKMKKAGKLLAAEIATRSEIEEYWGYSVASSCLTFGKLLKKHSFDLVIAASKYGKPLLEAEKELISRWRVSHKILVAFGAPKQGLHKILRQDNLNLDDVADFVVNAIPQQEVETVRTEEALFVTLGILNLIGSKS